MAVPVDGNSALVPAGASRSDTRQNRHSTLRIVIVNDVFHPDDINPAALLDRFTTLTGWAEAVRAQGADVTVCQRFGASADLITNGIVYRFVPDAFPARPGISFSGSEAMRRAVALIDPNVVHINGLDYPRAIRSLRMALPKKTAIVVQDHGGFDPRRVGVIRRWWMRAGLKAAAALLVATPDQIVEFRESGLVPSAVAIRDVMEGSTRFVPRRENNTAPDPRVLWVGRLNANKDPLTVIEGFARFAATKPHATLSVVYGESDLESAVRNAIRRHPHLARSVQLLGPVPHDALERVYGGADIFVLGSHREGSGYAAVEAMACAVVPALTDIPSFRALTDQGRVGALWQPGNAESLAAALARLAQPEAIARLRVAARRRFEECYSWEAIGTRAMAIYRDCSDR